MSIEAITNEIAVPTENLSRKLGLDYSGSILHPSLTAAIGLITEVPTDQPSAVLTRFHLMRTLVGLMQHLQIPPDTLRTLRAPKHTQSTSQNIDKERRSGLMTTKTGGRSEIGILKLEPDTSLAKQVKSILNIICPYLAEDKIDSLLRNGMLFKVKGRGPLDGSNLDEGHFSRKESIPGFTGLDTGDTEIAKALAGTYQLKSPDGKMVEYHYGPSRLLIAAIPINHISLVSVENGEFIDPSDWTEPLFLEIFAELGGHNLEDLFTAIVSGSIPGFEQGKSYLRQVTLAYPIFDEMDWNSPDYLMQFKRLITLKCWYDAIVETKQYYIIKCNRTEHNITIGGEQDLKAVGGQPNTEYSTDRHLKLFMTKITHLGIDDGFDLSEDLSELFKQLISPTENNLKSETMDGSISYNDIAGNHLLWLIALLKFLGGGYVMFDRQIEEISASILALGFDTGMYRSGVISNYLETLKACNYQSRLAVIIEAVVRSSILPEVE